MFSLNLDLFLQVCREKRPNFGDFCNLLCDVFVISAVSTGYFTRRLLTPWPLVGLAVFVPFQCIVWRHRANEYQTIVEAEIEAAEKIQVVALPFALKLFLGFT